MAKKTADKTRVLRERESRLAEFYDCDQEYRETKNQDALRRRARAMRNGPVADFQRGADRLAQNSWQEGENTRTRLRKNKFSGWKRLEE
jgi:hypothetical protein